MLLLWVIIFSVLEPDRGITNDSITRIQRDLNQPNLAHYCSAATHFLSWILFSNQTQLKKNSCGCCIHPWIKYWIMQIIKICTSGILTNQIQLSKHLRVNILTDLFLKESLSYFSLKILAKDVKRFSLGRVRYLKCIVARDFLRLGITWCIKVFFVFFYIPLCIGIKTYYFPGLAVLVWCITSSVGCFIRCKNLNSLIKSGWYFS